MQHHCTAPTLRDVGSLSASHHILIQSASKVQLDRQPHATAICIRRDIQWLARSDTQPKPGLQTDAFAHGQTANVVHFVTAVNKE